MRALRPQNECACDSQIRTSNKPHGLVFRYPNESVFSINQEKGLRYSMMPRHTFTRLSLFEDRVGYVHYFWPLPLPLQRKSAHVIVQSGNENVLHFNSNSLLQIMVASISNGQMATTQVEALSTVHQHCTDLDQKAMQAGTRRQEVVPRKGTHVRRRSETGSSPAFRSQHLASGCWQLLQAWASRIPIIFVLKKRFRMRVLLRLGLEAGGMSRVCMVRAYSQLCDVLARMHNLTVP